jgi:PEGA domain-containing protein
MVRFRLHAACTAFLSLILIGSAGGKDPAPQVLVWPASGQPIVRFNLGKLKEIGSTGKQHSYSIDVTVENLWGKRISKADFSLYFFDKSKTRIGEGWISISDVEPGQTIKFQMHAEASGTPFSMALAPQSLPPELQAYLPPRFISITVNSVPQGAGLKVDGVEAGTTPKIVQIAPGKHMLEFTKEGFNKGHFPLEITPQDTSGGSVSYELGTSAHDTVELRDGSVLVGDVESVSATEVAVRIGGTIQRLNRGQVKRITLVQREPTPQ